MSNSRLKAEIKKKRPFEVLEQEATLNVLRTSDQFQNRFGRLFREYGLTSSQYNVLRILRGENKPLPCQEISNRMIQVVPAMTGLLDRLELQDLIRRERATDDRRVIYVELTEKARELLVEMDQPVMDLHKALLGHLTESELKEMIRLLEKARISLNGATGDEA